MPKVVPLETYIAQLREAGRADPRAADLADRYARADVVKTEVADDGTHYDHIRVGTFPGAGAGPSPEPPQFVAGAGIPMPAVARPRPISDVARSADETIVVPRVPPENVALYYTKAPGGGTQPLLGHAGWEKG